MEWFLLLFNIVTIAVQGILQLLFMGHLTEKRVKLRHFAVCLAMLYCAGFTDFLAAFPDSAILLNILTLYILGRLGLKNNRPVSCVTAVLAVYIAQLSFGLMDSVTMLLFPVIHGNAPLLYLLIVLAAFLSSALCAICFRIISSHITLQNPPQGLLTWLLLPPGLFLFAVEFYILSVNYKSVVLFPGSLQLRKHIMLLLLQALGLGVLFCSLYAYRRICESFKAQADLALLEQETHSLKNYVSQAQIRYEKTRSFRHDVRNYLSVLDGFLRDGSIDQARDYLKNLDAAAEELSFPVHTGNPTVDILLGDKLELAKTDGTAVDISLKLPQDGRITDLDWCVIFANALDNAIRACRQGNNSKSIRISGEQQGDFYMLEFENTCPEDQPPVPDFGIGLGNIKSVALKYAGAVTAGQQHGLFRLHVLLDISVQPEGISKQRA